MYFGDITYYEKGAVKFYGIFLYNKRNKHMKKEQN